MKMLFRLNFILLLSTIALALKAQVINPASMDTSSTEERKGKISIGGYADTYYAYNFNKPTNQENPYAVSSSRHNEFNINLAFLDLKYISERVRVRLVPGFGTYMNNNYVNEPSNFQSIVEASVALKLFKTKNIWLEAGVIGSPYTNESYLSKDHINYSRSLAAENTPYYLSGAKLSIPISSKLIGHLYLLNGWQVIQTNNKFKSIGTQLEWRPNNSLLINWNTYMGDESYANPNYGLRFFTDVYIVYNPEHSKFSLTSCFYNGFQETKFFTGTDLTANNWWQMNLALKYKLTDKFALSARGEFFNDPLNIIITPITGNMNFNCASATAGLNYNITQNAMLRIEGRGYWSGEKIFNSYETVSAVPVDYNYLAFSNITIWF